VGFLTKANLALGSLTRTLGEIIIYSHSSGGTSEIKGVWGKEHLYTDVDGEMQVSSTNPEVGVRISDLIAYPEQGDTLRFMDAEYRVNDVREDGQGAAQLELYKM